MPCILPREETQWRSEFQYVGELDVKCTNITYCSSVVHLYKIMYINWYKIFYICRKAQAEEMM